MKIQNVFFYAIILALFASCSAKSGKGHDVKRDSAGDDVSINGFRLPDIPPLITGDEERFKYMMEHFWDNYDFSKVGTPDSCKVTENVMADYVVNISKMKQSEIIGLLAGLVDRADTTELSLKYFFDKMEYYFYHPLSPFANDEIMFSVTKMVSNAKYADFGLKERSRFMNMMLEKNRIGHKAADFWFEDEAGRRRNMYSVNAKYTLLFFYSPDCEHCAFFRETLKNDVRTSELTENGELKVLAFYSGNDEELWKSNLDLMPKKWIKGYDPDMEFENKSLYLVKATPTMYLLDKSKNVILKDATLDKFIDFISSDIR